MEKQKQIKLIGVCIVLILLIGCVLCMMQSCGEEDTTGLDDITGLEENTTLQDATNSEETTVLKETSVLEEITKVNETTIFDDTTISEEPTVSDETTTSKKPVSETETTSDRETTTQKSITQDQATTAEETTTKKITTQDQTTTVRETTTKKSTITDVTTSRKPSETENTTTSKKPSTTENTTTSKKPISEEETTTASDVMKITLTAPDKATVGVSFDVSYVSSKCVNIEWYINGEYQPQLDNEINPVGTLKFSEVGIYRVTVIGYTADWSKNVSDTVVIKVYRDESQLTGNAKEHDRAMYSWVHEYIYEENEAILQKVMELTECNILYQEVASNAAASDVAAFLQRRGEHNQTVYYLCGNATWAIEDGATSMLREVERAIDYNRAAGEYKFVGIQFDVEPYCLEDFEEHAYEYMTIYVENCKLAYEAAHRAGLLVEMCIPYWWESAYDFHEQLEDIIVNACDSVAVMNYYKKQKEAEHIETELNICKKYNKRIINITETIPAGLHGLTEDNTYYNDGIEAIEEMWNDLDGFFQYDKLGYAFHYLDVIIELLGLD